MNLLSRRAQLGCLALLAPLPCLAQGMPSLQGYTGLLNTPNALVAPEGAVDFLYSNQVDVQWRKTGTLGINDMMTIGMFPYMEGGLRLQVVHMANDAGISHLSNQIKVQIPFFPDWFPKIALGSQDIATSTAYLESRYGVISQDFGPLRLSLGGGTGPQRMKGLFGGGELTVAPWLQLVAENDTTDKNLGTKILGLTTKYSLEAQPRHVNYAFSLRVPLSGRAPSAPAPRPATSQPTPAPGAPLPEPATIPAPAAVPAPGARSGTPPSASTPMPEPTPTTLARDLAALGFENVRTGARGRTLVVEYENNRYNCNEIDGLGLVLGTLVSAAPQAYDTFLITLRKQNLRILEVEGPIQPCRQFFRSWDAPGEPLLQGLTIRQAEAFGSAEGVTWDGDRANQGWLNSRLFIGPGLSTVIGNELAALNYRLSIIPDLQTSLWRGAVLNWRWDAPVLWSQYYRPGQPYGSLGTTYSLDRVWVAQAVPLAQGLMAQVGGGRYDAGVKGAMGDLMWTSSAGQSRVTAKVAEFQVVGKPNQRVALGSYRFYFAPLETYVSATGGRFYNNDKGYRIDVKRFFRDTAFDVWYADTDVKKLGFTFTIPLTPRRGMTPGWLQVRGTEAWQYGMSTEVKTPSGANYLNPNIANVPDTTFNLERSFYNNDRLDADYVREHLLRLREAYQLFKPAPHY